MPSLSDFMVPPSQAVTSIMPLFQSPPQLARQQERVTHIWPDRSRRVWCQGTATLGFRRMAEQNRHEQDQVKISGPGARVAR